MIKWSLEAKSWILDILFLVKENQSKLNSQKSETQDHDRVSRERKQFYKSDKQSSFTSC